MTDPLAARIAEVTTAVDELATALADVLELVNVSEYRTAQDQATIRRARELAARYARSGK